MEMKAMDVVDVLELEMEELRYKMVDYGLRIFDLSEEEKREFQDLAITHKAREEEWKYHVGGWFKWDKVE